MDASVENTQRDRHFTIGAGVGNLLLECFLASRTFTESEDGDPAFTEEHLHSSYELLICRKGSGFQFVNGRAFRYADTSVFVFAPFVKHANICDPDTPSLRHSIRFEIPDDQTAAVRADAHMSAALQRLRQDGCFLFSADEPLQYLIGALAGVLQQNLPNPELLLSGLLSAIFSYVFYRLFLSCDADGGARCDWVLRNDSNQRKFLLDYYFDHLMYTAAGTEIRMDDICAQLHLSPSQLNRVLRDTYGTTFKQKGIEVRLAYIKYYLKYTRLSITEIAARTNFLSDSGFSLFFKKHTGLSPTQYRKNEAGSPLPQQPRRESPE